MTWRTPYAAPPIHSDFLDLKRLSGEMKCASKLYER